MKPTDVPMPANVARLPRDRRGYPVPWFVVWLDDQQRPVPPGEGTPDFRVMKPFAVVTAIGQSLCWVCGRRLGRHAAYVVGPMCAVNRTSAEPPSHRDCAEYAARACPFLVRPTMQRNVSPLPGRAAAAPGMMLTRNPGVTMVWITRKPPAPFRVPKQVPEGFGGGILLRLPDPTEVLFFREGRAATRAEVEAAIDSGLPLLYGVAQEEGPAAVRDLDGHVAEAKQLLPAA